MPPGSARGDLRVDVRPDRAAPSDRLPAGEGGPRLHRVRAALRTNTELTRQIHTLTVDLRRRVVTEGSP